MTLSLRGSKATAAISREGGFPQSIFFITLVVGYFACAQYDVKSPIVGVAATSPEGGSEVCFFVFASVAKQSPGRVVFVKYVLVHLSRGIFRLRSILHCHCEGAKRPRQSVGIKYGVYAARFTHGDRHANARDDRLFYCLCVNVE